MKITRIIAVFLFLLPFGVAMARPVSKEKPRWDRLTPNEANRELMDISTRLSFEQRLMEISERFHGVKYKLDPLGEGRGEDTDPIFRLDAFDCLTFVETVLAMADARRMDEAEAMLQKIRYKHGRIGWRFRHHLTWGQWLVENVQARRVEISTRRIAGGRCSVE